MDLLAGYGSDDSEQGDEQAAPQAPGAAPASEGAGTVLAGLPPPQLSGDADGPGRGGLFARLPPPSNDVSAGGFSSAGLSAAGFGLAPAAGVKLAADKRSAGRKVVQLRTMKPLAAADSDEEEQPKKKLKPSAKGLSFLDSLPKPVHEATPPAGSALGAGSSSARAQGGGARLPSSFFGDSNGSGDGAAERSVPAAEAQYASNEAFRVDMSGAAAAEVGPTRPPVSDYADYGSYAGYGDGGYVGYDAAQHQQQYAGAGDAYGPGQPDGNTMLAAAMAADTGRGGFGAADPFAGMNIEFKEVNQKTLTYVDPARLAANQGKRQALGKEHELQLRREADAAEPQKLAKRKHQISSLYHASKLKELEMLSDHGQTLKTKRETQAKYGW